MSTQAQNSGGSELSFPFLRPLLISFGAVLVLFALYEVAERLWLTDLPMATLHTLHLVRGLAAALLAAFLVGWFILRRSRPLLAAALSPGALSVGAASRAAERTRICARWFIQMRWVAIVVAITLIGIIVRGVGLLPEKVWWPLVVTVGVLALLNLVYIFFLRQGLTNSKFLAFQAYADLILLAVLLHFSGSVENPLANLMLFHVVIAGIILSRRQCFGVAIVGSALFALLAGFELAGVLPHYTLEIFPHAEHEGAVVHAAHEPLYVASKVSLLTTVLLFTAFFVTTLADRLRRDERQLESYAERISTERQLLEQALETTGTALCVCDADFSHMWNNRQWQLWFGKAGADVLQQQQVCGPDPPARGTVPDDKARVREIEMDSAAGAESSQDDDSRRTLLLTTAPLAGQGREASRIVQLAQDITEQKRTQASLMRAGQLAAVGEMAGEVAHEVNNPVAIIGTKARLLLDNHRDELSEKVTEELAKITNLADRIAGITQGLLSYSRPSVGARTHLDVRIPVRNALSLAGQRAYVSDMQIEDELPDEPLNVMANGAELEQVFLNLFLNSVDAMKDGGTLTVSATTDGDHHAIVIGDTGTGIDKKIQERVFEPFFTTKPEGEGTGLGLSICAGLIRSNGGTVELASKADRGTEFTVRLPVYDPTRMAESNG